MKSNRRKKQKQPLSNSERLAMLLNKNPMTLPEILDTIDGFKNRFYDSAELELELLLSNGFPLEMHDENFILKTNITSMEEQTFCVVDIETNGSNVHKGQIIELGAVKIKNGEIIDKFDSLVYAKDIPRYIQEVTNITPNMLQDAPVIEKVLKKFKKFLEDDVFVAHDIKFDYKFISQSFEKYDLGKLENRKLCTIDLAKRTIRAERYGLDFLKGLLNINIDNHHRAYSDALSTAYILKDAMQSLPEDVNTVEELIKYSKSDNIINNKKEKKEKKEEDKNV